MVMVFSAILSCPRDNHLLDEHVKNLDSLGYPLAHCAYNAMGGSDKFCVPGQIIQCNESYEDLAVKMYGIFKHALSFDPDYILKSDVNTRVVSIDWDKVFRADFAGVVFRHPARQPPREALIAKGVKQLLLLDGRLPGFDVDVWCSGPCYVISRRLAEFYVQQGPWNARAAFFAEDLYLSKIAKEHGIEPVAAVKYADVCGDRVVLQGQ